MVYRLTTFSVISGLFGGLLGICLGFTFIAVADVIYTFSIRLIIVIWRKKKSLAKVNKLSSNLQNNLKILPVVEAQNITHETNTHSTVHAREFKNKNSDIWFLN